MDLAQPADSLRSNGVLLPVLFIPSQLLPHRDSFLSWESPTKKLPRKGGHIMNEIDILQTVLRAQAGDNHAFGQLVTQFESSVFAVVYRRLRNSAEAAEVTQEVFLRAFRKLEQLREPERFVGWLKRIAVRLSINRAVRRPPEAICAPESFAFIGGDQSAPHDRLFAHERATQLRASLSQLRRMDRETLEAFYFEGQSLKEMSDRFASPVGTIKRRLHTARARLKDALCDFQPA